MSQNILFFSERCPHSKKLISKIINTPLYNTLQRVCVDSSDVRSRLPKFVVSVPLVYLSQASPRYGQVIIDPNIWLWLEEQLRAVHTATVSNFSQPQAQPVHNPAGQQGPPAAQPGNTSAAPPAMNDSSDFLAYNEIEMGGGISTDLYAPFSKVDSQAPPSQPLYPHSYETVGIGGQPKTTPQAGNAAPNTLPTNLVQPQSGSGQNSRSGQRMDKFDQDLAMRKTMRDNEPYAKNIHAVQGVPQNFDQQWSQNSGGGGAPGPYVQ